MVKALELFPIDVEKFKILFPFIDALILPFEFTIPFKIEAFVP